jgi:hypothetical protein
VRVVGDQFQSRRSGAQVTELKDRLVNLDVAPGFTAVAQVLASNPGGTLTGRIYPRSLVRPDREGVEPKIGISWRPLTASSLLIKGGYGMNYDTSVYQNIALQMAQQAPLSKSHTHGKDSCWIVTLRPGLFWGAFLHVGAF